jgi:hypothetical protein
MLTPYFSTTSQKAAGVRGAGHPFVHEAGGPVGEGTVHDVAVAGNPADIGGTPVDIGIPMVEGPLEGHVGVEVVAPGGVDDPLGLAGGAAGIEDERAYLRRP